MTRRFLLAVGLVGLVLLMGPVSAQEGGSALIAGWDFESGDGSQDVSGNGYNGTFMKQAAVRDSERGKVLYLDGVDDEFRAGAPFSTLDDRFFPPSAIAVSLWVKLEREPTGAADLFQYVSGGRSRFFVRVNPGNIPLIYAHGRDGTRYVRSSKAMEVGKWHHVALSYEAAGGLRFYLDGEKVAEAIALGDLAWDPPYDSFRLGGYTGGAKDWLNGEVDEVKIFGKGLSAEEVAAIMAPPTPEEPATIEIAHWNFDGVSGGEDATGNGYNGTFMKQAAVRDSERGKVLYLDGVDDEFRIGTPFSTLDDRFFPPSAIAVSLWVKLKREPTGAADLFQYVSGGRSRFFVRINPGNLPLLYVNGRDGSRYVRSSKAMEVGKWHHVALSYESGTGLQFYLDGEKVAEAITLGDLAWDPPYDSFRLGGYTGGAKDWLNGEVDEVKIFGKGLSAEEVAALMAPPEPPTPPTDENFKTIAAMEGELRTFESLEENGNALLLWGTYSNLFLAQIDASGNLLISAKRIVSSETRITGIAKPVPFNGGWLTAVRETDANHIDQIRLLAISVNGDVSQNLLWLKDFKRISLPIIFRRGESLKILFAAFSKDLALYHAPVENLPELPAARRIHTLGGEVLYPPIFMGASEGDQTALLVFHRGKNPPPMKVLFLGGALDEVEREMTVEHAGGFLNLSNPFFQLAGGSARIGWYESLSKRIAPRLVVSTLADGRETRQMAVMKHSGELPRFFAKWENGALAGVMMREAFFKGPLGFFKVMLNPSAPQTITRSILKKELATGEESYHAELIQFFGTRPGEDVAGGAGIVLKDNNLGFVSFEEEGKKEEASQVREGNSFGSYIECLKAGTLEKTCKTRAMNELAD